MTRVNIIALTIALIIAASCKNNHEFKVNETGVEYKFIEENSDGIKPKIGDVVTIKMRYTFPNGDVIEESGLFRTQLKKPTHAGGSIENSIAIMHKGDSAIFKINAFDYYTKTRGISLPEGLSADDKLTFYIRLSNVTSLNEFAKEREMAVLSDEREEEKMLKGYLERSNIQVEPTISGLYIVELKKGSGAAPVPGKMVTVHYLGYFIDGRKFDSSYDRNEPFKFRYGVGEVIQGWDEGVAKMTVGSKCKLIIPSHLAYGSVQSGPIPPNSTLIFEIELLDVEK